MCSVDRAISMPLWRKRPSKVSIGLKTPFIEVMVAGRSETILLLPFLFRHMAHPRELIIHRSILKGNLNMALQSHLPVPVSWDPWHPLIPADSLGKRALCDAMPCWHHARGRQHQTLLCCTVLYCRLCPNKAQCHTNKQTSVHFYIIPNKHYLHFSL